MKIAIITATPQNVRLGSGTFVANALLGTALRSQGHVVDVVSPEAASGPLGHVAHRFLWNARLDPRVFDGYDVVVGYDMDGFAVIGRLGVPFVSYIHGIIADEAGFERGWTRKALRSMAEAERRAVHRADMVVTTSDYAAARLRQLYRYDGDVEVVPPPIDLQRWEGAVAAARRGAGVRGRGRPTVLCVCVQYPRKNVATLVRAIAILRREMPDVECRIAGKGPEWDNLRRLADELGVQANVTLLGHVPYRELVREYAGCHVFCLPSLQEGFGIVFAEAMAAGKPVVASRSSSTPELVEDGVQGLLARPLDARDLAGRLREVLANPDRAGALGMAGRARVGEFDAPLVATRFSRVIAKLLDPQRTA